MTFSTLKVACFQLRTTDQAFKPGCLCDCSQFFSLLSNLRWVSERRALLRADLDAGFLHVYGLNRAEAEHVLDSFNVVRKYEERDFGDYRTKRLVLEAYDRMAKAIVNGGNGWSSLGDPPAGAGPRHPNR